ncbi:MAG: efflux RND transporter permease subunit [Hyphomicrobiales bacterium]|nr:efflux RND transporter permease subunit [Hyphomicrobiales bacterium]
MIRLRDIAQVRRAYSDPPQPMFPVNGKPAIGLAIAMRDGGDILTLGRNVKKAIDVSVANLPRRPRFSPCCLSPCFWCSSS